MPDIVLATLNAKYIHASFGLRYLMANLGGLQERACMAEFDVNQRPLDIVEALLARNPRIVGLGVYIWNATETSEVVALLKRVRPEIIVILGGPEVSYDTDGCGIVALADHVITGEADLRFAEVCGSLLDDRRTCQSGRTGFPPAPLAGGDHLPMQPGGPSPGLPKVIAAEVPQLDRIASPYDLYTDEDLAHRVVYVEASRGCPFTCEFCLSSLDVPVRAFPLDSFLAAMQRLLDRGATQFKFVDRTFNLHLPTSTAILEFFLGRWRDGLFLHFEMIPDRLPEQLRALIKKFPPGAVQFEVGIQTFDDAVSKNISRRQNLERLADNLRFLRDETGVHVHADLIVGLPGEGMESFGRGFDRLVALAPQEIQVGILKRLRGTPIVRHDAEYGMCYSPHPPYEILATRDIPFADMQRMRRFARYWDIVANSGQFATTLPMLWDTGYRKADCGKGETSATRKMGEAVEKRGAVNAGRKPGEVADLSGIRYPLSPFTSFLRFSDWLHATLRRTHQIALQTIAQSLFDFLTVENHADPTTVAAALEADWHRTPGREALALRGMPAAPAPMKPAAIRTARRQARHTQVR